MLLNSTPSSYKRDHSDFHFIATPTRSETRNKCLIIMRQEDFINDVDDPVDRIDISNNLGGIVIAGALNKQSINPFSFVLVQIDF